MLDILRIREDFPILAESVHGHPLVYLDNAATMQVPQPVLDAVNAHYHHNNANVHRGVHTLSARATDALERARHTAAAFVGAQWDDEIIFTSGTTASINLVASALSCGRLGPGDEVIVAEQEHHSNLVPWQEACRRTGARLRIWPVSERGEMELSALAPLLGERTALVACAWVSNVTGAVAPVQELCAMAHDAGAQVLLDGAQAMKLGVTDVQALGVDYLVFSGHKLGALTGIGVLYGRRGCLGALPPTAFGGGMIDQVELGRATFGPLPLRLEAGTPNYVGAISLAAALDYLTALGLPAIAAQEDALTAECRALLSAIPGVQLLGSPSRCSGAVSFTVPGIHPFDIGALLDAQGVAVRTGHLCAMPLLTRFGLDSVVRVSPAFYNTQQELQALCAALEKALALLQK